MSESDGTKSGGNGEALPKALSAASGAPGDDGAKLIVECVECLSKFLVPSHEIQQPGRRLRCSVCSHEWLYDHVESTPTPTESALKGVFGTGDSGSESDDSAALSGVDSSLGADGSLGSGGEGGERPSSSLSTPEARRIQALQSRLGLTFREDARGTLDMARPRPRYQEISERVSRDQALSLDVLLDPRGDSEFKSFRERKEEIKGQLRLLIVASANIGVALGLVALALFWREPVVNWQPVLARYYYVFGIGVRPDEPPFALENVEVEPVIRESGFALGVSAELANLGGRERVAPRLRLSVSDEEGLELFVHMIEPAGDVIASRARLRYEVVIESLSPRARDLNLTYLDRFDDVGQSVRRVSARTVEIGLVGTIGLSISDRPTGGLVPLR